MKSQKILLIMIFVMLVLIIGLTAISLISPSFKINISCPLFILLAILFTLVFLSFSFNKETRSLQKQDQALKTERKLLSLIDLETEKLSISLKKDKIFRYILEFCVRTLDCEMEFLLLYDYKSETFKYEAGYNMDKTMLIGTEFNSVGGVIGKICQEKQIILIDKVKEIERNGQGWILADKSSYLKTSQKFVAIPLIVEENVIGILGLYCPGEVDILIKDNSLLLSIIKNQLSIALGSAIQSEYAILDRLTMCYNHEYFRQRLKEEILRCKRYKLNASLLMIDIDHFKSFNDTYGHQVGDVVLKEVATIIKSTVRIVDLCARYGGEEFAVLLPETSREGAIAAAVRIHNTVDSGAVGLAERLRQKIEQHDFKIDGKQLKVTISLGVGSWEYDKDIDKESDQLIKQADEQLYQAKNTGRNKVCYPEMK